MERLYGRYRSYNGYHTTTRYRGVVQVRRTSRIASRRAHSEPAGWRCSANCPTPIAVRHVPGVGMCVRYGECEQGVYMCLSASYRQLPQLRTYYLYTILYTPRPCGSAVVH